MGRRTESAAGGCSLTEVDLGRLILIRDIEQRTEPQEGALKITAERSSRQTVQLLGRRRRRKKRVGGAGEHR